MEFDEINRLQAQIDALQAQLENMRAAAEPERASRRGMLKLAAGAAAGAAVGAVGLGASRVSAVGASTTGDDITLGEINTNTVAQTSGTVIKHSHPTEGPAVTAIGSTSNNANILTVRDAWSSFLANPDFSAYPAAVGGYGRLTVKNGVYGFSSLDGYGVVGSNGNATVGAGLLVRGSHANMHFDAAGDAPSTRTAAYLKGHVICDNAGDLWICVEAGSPGTWRKVSGAATAGSFHAINPIRVYDSRKDGYSGNNGLLERLASRDVSVADARDDAGTVVTANAIPSGATAIAFNITVAGTTGTNYLSIAPGGTASTPTTSIINFSASQNLANASVVGISSDRKVRVWCGDDVGSAHFIIDVSGYYR